MKSCWRSDRGVFLDIKVRPGAAKVGVGGLAFDADGGARLIVRVTAPPEDGKANKAVLVALAAALGLPKSALSLAQGAKARHKTVAINADPAEIGTKIDALAREGKNERGADH